MNPYESPKGVDEEDSSSFEFLNAVAAFIVMPIPMAYLFWRGLDYDDDTGFGEFLCQIQTIVWVIVSSVILYYSLGRPI